MTRRDYLLLKYLSNFTEPVSIDENKLPDEVRVNFTFYGTDRQRFPNSIHFALLDLNNNGFIKQPYAGKVILKDFARREIATYEQQNRPEIFAEQCDKVLHYLSTIISDGIHSPDLSEAVRIDVETLQHIGDELKDEEFVFLSINDGYYTFSITDKGRRFLLKSSFKNELIKGTKFVVNVERLIDASQNQGVVTTASMDGAAIVTGNNSNASAGKANQTITTNAPPKEPEKKKWWEPIVEDIKKRWIPYALTTLFGFFTGRVTDKAETPTGSQPQTQITIPKTSTETPSNKNTISLDSVQKNSY